MAQSIKLLHFSFDHFLKKRLPTVEKVCASIVLFCILNIFTICAYLQIKYRFEYVLILSFTIHAHTACAMPAPNHARRTIFPAAGGQAEYLNVWGAGHQPALLEVIMIR